MPELCGHDRSRVNAAIVDLQCRSAAHLTVRRRFSPIRLGRTDRNPARCYRAANDARHSREMRGAGYDPCRTAAGAAGNRMKALLGKFVSAGVLLALSAVAP